jgi:DNA-binding MarR family transcriptional regulator/N-acetylglutamate synthase-like GNAT family acetyltransferase
MKKTGPAADAIEAVRRFSRFYTRRLGLLDEHLLASEFSLTEVRILYELAQRDGLTATDLGRELGIDAGHLSRILKRFEQRRLLDRRAAPADARQSLLELTAAGRAAFAPLDRGSREQIAAWLAPLSPARSAELLHAMGSIERLLAPGPRAEPAVPYLLRPHQVGDIGWITHRQGLLYAEEYGWDESFEALVAEIAANFVKSFDATSERCWIAEREGEIVGSVFLVRQTRRIAKLRLLYVEPAARGLGIGARLTDECIRFARAKGYKTLTLWTNDVLVSARRIYQAAGFELAKEERHHSFGKDLVGQNWNLAL